MGPRTTQRPRFRSDNRWQRCLVACLTCSVVAEAVTAASATWRACCAETRRPAVVVVRRGRGHRQSPSRSKASRPSLLLAFVANPPASPARAAKCKDGSKKVTCGRIRRRSGSTIRTTSCEPRTAAAWVGDAEGVMTTRPAASRDSISPPRKDPPSNPAPAPPVSWLDRVEQLRRFKAEHGHTRVPKRYHSRPDDDDDVDSLKTKSTNDKGPDQSLALRRGLGAWVQRQRQRRDRLSQDQVDLLNNLGFCWSVSSPISAFVEPAKRPHTNSAPCKDSDPESAATSPADGEGPSGGSLRDKEVVRVGDGGANWWDQYHELTVQYADAASIPKSSAWGAWLRRQRHDASHLESPSSQQERLTAAVVCNDSTRERQEVAVVSYSQARRLAPPSRDPKQMQQLPQEELHRRREALNAWDRRWDWTEHDHRWNSRFGQLVAYRREHGDCCVPISYADVPGLGPWVSAQRKSLRSVREQQQHRPDRLRHETAHHCGAPPERVGRAGAPRRQLWRIQQLDSIGFVWCMQDLLESQWELLASGDSHVVL